MNEYKLSDLSVGMTASFQKTITLEDEEAFRKISGDLNPLHQNDNFANEISNGKYKCHVSFGMLTASLYSTIAGMYLPGKYSLIHSFDEISFMKPVFVGDFLTVTGEITDKDDYLKMIKLKVVITNQDGKKVSRAQMKVIVMK